MIKSSEFNIKTLYQHTTIKGTNPQPVEDNLLQSKQNKDLQATINSQSNTKQPSDKIQIDLIKI